jgi:hypothetical protein
VILALGRRTLAALEPAFTLLSQTYPSTEPVVRKGRLYDDL